MKLNPDLDVKIAIDLDLIGLAKTYNKRHEFQYWRGPLFKDNLGNISGGVTVYSANNNQRFFSGTLELNVVGINKTIKKFEGEIEMKILAWFIGVIWRLFKMPFIALKKQWKKEGDRNPQKKSASYLFCLAMLFMVAGSWIGEFTSYQALAILCYFLAFIFLIIGIDVFTYLEGLLISDHIKKKPRKLFFLIILVVKEIAICHLILLCLAIPTILIIYWIQPLYLLENHLGWFIIILVFIVFLVALVLYWLLSESIVRQKINLFFLKAEYVEKHSIVVPQLRRYKEEAAPVIDLAVIFATVLLLANSTVPVIEFADTYTAPNGFASFEVKTFLNILSIYLMAAYYKILQIIAVSKLD